MGARGAVARAAIDGSVSLSGELRPTGLETYRQPVEAMDDLDYAANEAGADMGQGSCQGQLLHRASLEREWRPADLRDMEMKRRGLGDGTGHYGPAFAARRWQEWVEDESLPERGYMRTIWGARAHQTGHAVANDVGERAIRGTELYRNVLEVLELLPKRMRQVLLMQHEHRAHDKHMRKVFGSVVRIAVLSAAATEACEAARAAGATKATSVYAFLQGVADRIAASKPQAGERALVASICKEMGRELKEGYAAFEKARGRLPRGRRYPHHSATARARRLSVAR